MQALQADHGASVVDVFVVLPLKQQCYSTCSMAALATLDKWMYGLTCICAPALMWSIADRMQSHLTEVGSVKGSDCAIAHTAQELLGGKELWALPQDVAHGLADIKLAEVVRLGSNSHWCLSMLALP